jgi:hypothetical protein
MSTETLLLLIVIVLIVLALPTWPHSKEWGYAPTSVLTVALIIFLIWAIAGGRPLFRHSLGHDMRQAGEDAADSMRRAVR